MRPYYKVLPQNPQKHLADSRFCKSLPAKQIWLLSKCDLKMA